MRNLILAAIAFLLFGCSKEDNYASTLERSAVIGAHHFDIKADKPLFVWIDKSAADANAGLGLQPKDMAFETEISLLDENRMECVVREKLTSFGFNQADCGFSEGRLRMVMTDSAGRRLSVVLQDAANGQIGGPVYIQGPGLESKPIKLGKAQFH